MRAWGQRPTFMIRPGDEALDRRLDALGYLLDGADADRRRGARSRRRRRSRRAGDPRAGPARGDARDLGGGRRRPAQARGDGPRRRAEDLPARPHRRHAGRLRLRRLRPSDRHAAGARGRGAVPPPRARHRAHPGRRRLGGDAGRHHLRARGRGRQRAGPRRLRRASAWSRWPPTTTGSRPDSLCTHTRHRPRLHGADSSRPGAALPWGAKGGKRTDAVPTAPHSSPPKRSLALPSRASRRSRADAHCRPRIEPCEQDGRPPGIGDLRTAAFGMRRSPWGTLSHLANFSLAARRGRG